MALGSAPRQMDLSTASTGLQHVLLRPANKERAMIVKGLPNSHTEVCMRVRTMALVLLMLFTIQPIVHQQSQTGARVEQAGDVVMFALPAEIDIVTGANGDEVILAGRTYHFTDAQNC